MTKDLIAVLDFGGQYSHLITRRIRECEVYSELVPFTTGPRELVRLKARGVILSGGPASVYDPLAPKCSPEIFRLGIPVLGICYGLQLMVSILGGHVKETSRHEYGRTLLRIKDDADLFANLGSDLITWMSHGDYAEKLPRGFDIIADSDSCPTGAIRDREHKLFGVQFHPEVSHTERGNDIIRNFVKLTGCRANWTPHSIIQDAVEQIRATVGDGNVLCAVSGGVDSTTTAVLAHKAVGNRLACIFVNHGLLRKNEEKTILKTLVDDLRLNTHYVDASARFLSKLSGVRDAEEKRRVIGEEFIRVFDEESKKLGDYSWLAQGTLYPDVIESAGTSGPASRIKTHHNVGGIPDWTKFKIVEPLRFLYKDEVRRVAKELGLPDEIVYAHPFPGPGLAVRIIGEVSADKLRICREAGAVVENILREGGWYDLVWQAFAIVGDDEVVGVQGDHRELGRMLTVRVVTSSDGMTADWARIPHEMMESISNSIIGEVEGVSWVAYAITSKPPSTIEPC